ncbi:MAG: hypothetical protein R3301_03015 [Saprospiraceae bacterium]|nr:hypothetical protein [Saprospiraceae bacterium]
MSKEHDPGGLQVILHSYLPDASAAPDEEEVIRLLAERIRHMLDRETDLLFSTLYRLDVYESKINQVLQSPVQDPATGLARLVLERQKQKLRTREEYGGLHNVDDPFNPA